jgi:gamma-glutamylaminecyclotransferase
VSRTLVFVYGSLKRGFRHHAEIEGAEFVREAVTAAGYALYRVGEYPALVRAGTATVRGEIYRVRPDHLERLDRFEGCPELYRRIPVKLSDGALVEGYAMEAAEVGGCPIVPDGNWRR